VNSPLEAKLGFKFANAPFKLAEIGADFLDEDDRDEPLRFASARSLPSGRERDRWPS
jgi:hypothetical protein